MNTSKIKNLESLLRSRAGGELIEETPFPQGRYWPFMDEFLKAAAYHKAIDKWPSADDALEVLFAVLDDTSQRDWVVYDPERHGPYDSEKPWGPTE